MKNRNTKSRRNFTNEQEIKALMKTKNKRAFVNTKHRKRSLVRTSEGKLHLVETTDMMTSLMNTTINHHIHDCEI